MTVLCKNIKCKTPNRERAKFCKRCGVQLGPERCSDPMEKVKDGEPPAISIDGLVGLIEVKSEIQRIVKMAQGMKACGRPFLGQHLHTIFIGNTGTGKSKIANTLPEVFFKSGITTKKDAKVVNAVDFNVFAKELPSNYKSAKGGILFIDNVHKLVPPRYLPGEVIPLDKLIFEMETHPCDPILILAGLPEGLNEYLEFNPDVKKKFRFVFKIPDLKAEEMLSIAKAQIKMQSICLSNMAEAKLEKVFRYLVKKKDTSFGNGHEVTRIVDEVIQEYYLRSGPDQQKAILPEDIRGQILIEKTTEEILNELDQFVGMSEIKGHVRNLISLVNTKKKDAEKTGKPFVFGEHMVLTGNPGTGKTTIARKMGEIFSSIDLLPRGHVIEVDRSKMVSQFVGETPKVVQKICDDAIGGILFIDEAYTLKKDEHDTWGQEAIDTLLKRMEDDRGKFLVIAAGYAKEMRNFIDSNPGLTSRFKSENFFHLPDYNPSQMVEIFRIFSRLEKIQIEGGAEEKLLKALSSIYERRGKDFGNGRDVRNFYEACNKRRAVRVSLSGNHELVLREEDIPGDEIENRKDAFKAAIAELDQMIGLSSVKKEVKKIIDYLEIEKVRALSGGKSTSLSVHFVFMGNPGTGKTSVARVLATVFKGMGLLSKGHLVETQRADLVAGYVGQTAGKVNRVIDTAMGGVLFIDEAYTLVSSGGVGPDYGQEAIDTLLKRMEDDRGKFIVIVAGYVAEMDRFLQSNPGLTSRFTKHIHFEDYLPSELKEIFLSMASSKGMNLTSVVDGYLDQLMLSLHQDRDSSFANGRTVRNLFETVLQNQASRVSSMRKEGIDITSLLNFIEVEDFPQGIK